VIVSPDAGGVERARRIADRLHAEGVVTIIKRRIAANVIEEMQVVGDVTNKTCIIVDDMIDTGGMYFPPHSWNFFIFICTPYVD
jgi:ribose-phosphate pyrophosphokinase